MLKKLKIKNSLTEQYSSRLIKVIKTDKDREINLLYNKIFKAWKKNKTVYVCGNGGSAGNANHIANDLIFAAGKKNKKGIKVESLASNPAIITCLANDIGYQNIFSEQIKVKGVSGDLLIILSGSGNSKNVINAINQAKINKLDTFAILGFDGGKCKKILKDYIHYNVHDMQISEDMQMIVLNMCIQKLMKQKI
jgi:D-sedoheptulose 7-phosphate isomerase